MDSNIQIITCIIMILLVSIVSILCIPLLVPVIIILLICSISSFFIQNYNQNNQIRYNDKYMYNGIREYYNNDFITNKDIRIDNDTFNKYVDIVTR